MNDVSELVEAINKMMNHQTEIGKSFNQWFQEILDIGAAATAHYTKTPCPECGGSGQKTIISGQTPETYDAVNIDCPECHGRGYKWKMKR